MKIAMKLLIVGSAAVIWSCNGQQSKDPTTRADSTNEEMIDSSHAAGAAPAIAEKDAKFAVDAANGGMAEVQLGEMAQSRGADSSVKAFGKMMVTDHSKANDELKMIAAGKNITLPAAPDNEKQKVATDLSSKSGADFDKAYIKQMVDDHEKTVKLFEDAQKDVQDSDLKAFAVKTLPVLRTHLEHVKALKKTK
ncbi:DUF4142 domain-containing protein [Niabella sp. CC-SYL272]|uniref:DUF4142 domain-containing protein n=1 Tax=Niabella agricola TaxID=2891571 RepID=UPI001F25D25D|nr:DUF4142 domain-containing protein [Niabella agricola]MCF3109393.1 DUF4142 domain-containing protein [Niabella agricola]